MQSITDKTKAAFARYIDEKKLLIVDCNASSRAGLAKTFIDLGAKTSNVILASSFAEGKQEITKQKPFVVVADYELGKSCGLDLLQTHRKEFPESKDCLFILVTGNTSQAAVARAAEEDVDAFILKPYTIDILRQTIMKTALAKVQPSNYTKTIEEGKTLLATGNVDGAMEKFREAIKLDQKPSLACFYLGQAELVKQAIEQAENNYKEGLVHNKIHYKCMVGLFDLMMQRKMHKEAYDVVKRISRYFPANPQRLASVLRLAVMTQSYEDIERYYQTFCNIDQRDDSLIKYVCAALVVCGKYYLQTKVPSRALELFQKAAITASGRTKILREIITSLAAYDFEKEGQEFLKRFPPETQSQVDYLAMQYLILDKGGARGVIIESGRKLIQKDIHDPLIYKILIKRSVEAGFKDSAESFMREAEKRWAPLKAEFEDAFNQAKALDAAPATEIPGSPKVEEKKGPSS